MNLNLQLTLVFHDWILHASGSMLGENDVSEHWVNEGARPLRFLHPRVPHACVGDAF